MPEFYARKSNIVFSESGATVLAFNLRNGEKLATYAEGKGYVSAIAVVEDMLIAGMTSGDIVSFKILNSRVSWKMNQDYEVSGILIIQKNFIISHSKNNLKLWNAQGVNLSTVPFEHKILQCHIYGSNNVVILNNRPSIGIWSFDNVKLNQIAVYDTFLNEEVPNCIFVSEGSIIYSTSNLIIGELLIHGSVVKFSRSFPCSPAHDGHGSDKSVTCIGVTNSMIVAGYGNNVVQCWSIIGEPSLKWVQCHNECTEGREGITCLKIDDSSNTVYSGAWDHYIRSWDLYTGNRKKFEHQHSWSIRNFIVCIDIDRIISGGNDGMTRVWNTSDNCQVWEALHSAEIHAPHVFEEFIYVGSKETASFGLQQWTVKGSKCQQRTVLGGAMRALDMAYSFNLRRIYVSTVNCTFFAVDRTSCEVVWKKVPAENWVVRVFAIQTFVITFTNPNKIHCWDAKTGDSRWRFYDADYNCTYL